MAFASAKWVRGVSFLNGRVVGVVAVWWREIRRTHPLLINIISLRRSHLPAWACSHDTLSFGIICSRSRRHHVWCFSLLKALPQWFALAFCANNCLKRIGAGAWDKFSELAVGPLWGAKPVRRRLFENDWFCISVVGVWSWSFSLLGVVHSRAFLRTKLGTSKMFEDDFGFWMVRAGTGEFFLRVD